MLPAETQLLAIGLLNYADDEGFFLAHPALIRGELMPFVESHANIARMLDELAEIEYVRLGEDAQGRKVGMVVNFKRHQRVDRPQRSKLAGLVEFPNWSPKIPGIIDDDSSNAPRVPADDSVSDRGGLAVGMEGNGKGMEGNGSSAAAAHPVGELALPLPLAGLSMPSTHAEAVLPESSGIDDPAALPEPEKKEGGAAGGPEGYAEAAVEIWPGQPVPEWVLLAPAGQRRVLAVIEKKKRGGGRPESEQAGRAAPRTEGRVRDECFEFMVKLTGARLESVTKPMRGEINTALKVIRDVCPGLDLEELAVRAAVYRVKFKDAHLSPSALAKHWGSLESMAAQKKQGGRGTGGRIEEPAWDWRAVALNLELRVMPGESWAVLERSWQVQILREKKKGGEGHE